MTNQIFTSKRPHQERKQHYQTKMLFLLWAVFLSVLGGYLTPEAKGEVYQPKVASQAVKGAVTGRSALPEDIAFVREEIVALEVQSTSAGQGPQGGASPTATPTPEQLPDKKYDRSRQIGEYTWTIDVADEERAGTADEVLNALNDYRQKNGRSLLALSADLSRYAQSRADTFNGNGKTDSHAGFMDYIHNQDGFTKLGFMKLGENSSFGYKVSGTTLIESVYAGDSPHDSNQLSSDWTYVGIGVNGVSSNIIFGGNPM